MNIPAYFKLVAGTKEYSVKLPGSKKMFTPKPAKVYTFDHPKDVQHLVAQKAYLIETDNRGVPLTTKTPLEATKAGAKSYTSMNPKKTKDQNIVAIALKKEVGNVRKSTVKTSKHVNPDSLKNVGLIPTVD